jgi:hypothetical protein
MSNVETIRSKREAQATLWKASGTTKDLAERARNEKQIEKIRAETPTSSSPHTCWRLCTVQGRQEDT